MSFSDDMDLARVDTIPTERCDGCGCPPHPTTRSFYLILCTMRRLCLACFFSELGEERRKVQQSDMFREGLRERQFNEVLFMGSGNHSLLRKRDLCERLECAIKLLADTQQVPMSTDSKESCDVYRAYCEAANEAIDVVVRDVAKALTGKEWEPKED